MTLFGMTLSEIDVALDILILVALSINMMIISKALELLMELYEKHLVMSGLREWREDVEKEKKLEHETWEDAWL